MPRSRTSLLAVAMLAGAWITAVPTGAKAASDEPLGIALEGYPYPHPVAYLPVVEGFEPLRLACMDVAPTVQANGRTVILLHGRNFPSSYWGSVVKALTGKGYRVVVPDQIGFGKSSKPNLPASFDAMARNTALLLDRLGVERAHIVGHSMGGMLAARFARTYPARIERLVLYAPIGLEDYRFTVPPVPTERLLEQERELTAYGYRRQLVTNYALTIPPERVEPFVEVRERVKGSGEYERWLRSFVASHQMIWGQPVVPEIPLITAPTLFLMGGADKNAPGRPFAKPEDRPKMGQNADLARALAAHMPAARALVFEGVGHLPHMEDEPRFNRELIAFLKE